ncbi:FHA domain-containing protein [Pseudomonadota bacterium]
MAQLKLSFKGHPITVHHFDDNSEVTIIGSDPGCTLVIDSLAIAPLQAKIICDQNGCKVIALTNKIPTLVNHHTIEEHQLSHGDVIQMGKHTLTFAEDDQIFASPPLNQAKPTKTDAANPPLNIDNTNDQPTLEGISSEDIAAVEQQSQLTTCVQIVNGKHFGRVIPIDSGLTRLGINGLVTAAIAHRKDGYFLTHLEGSKLPYVNGDVIEEHSQQLFDGDKIQIGNIRMIFHHQSGIAQSDIALDA